MLEQGLGVIVNWRCDDCGNILPYSALCRSPRVYLVIDTKCVSEEAKGEMNDLSRPPAVTQAVGLASAFRGWPELPLSAQNQRWFPLGCVLVISPWSADHRLEFSLYSPVCPEVLCRGTPTRKCTWTLGQGRLGLPLNSAPRVLSPSTNHTSPEQRTHSLL